MILYTFGLQFSSSRGRKAWKPATAWAPCPLAPAEEQLSRPDHLQLSGRGAGGQFPQGTCCCCRCCRRTSPGHALLRIQILPTKRGSWLARLGRSMFHTYSGRNTAAPTSRRTGSRSSTSQPRAPMPIRKGTVRGVHTHAHKHLATTNGTGYYPLAGAAGLF